VPYCEAGENVVNNISQQASSEWCLFPTASSLLHPNLADEIIKLTTDKNFKFDVIGMPYGMYSLGIRSSKSPFYTSHKRTLIRRSKLILSTQLHNEISYNSDKIFDMPFINDETVLYHCTHKDVDTLFGHVIRYTKYEAAHDDSLSCSRAFLDIWKALFTVVFRRRSFMLGWNGIALSLVYINYFVTRYLFVWERNRDNGNVIYPILRKKIDELWDEKNVTESKNIGEK
jgi:hypothetical protein